MRENSPACFVANIDVALSDKIKEDLINQGFEISFPAHTLFSAKKKGVSCTLYQSGKLTVQGKDKTEFITYYLEPEILKKLSYSYPEQLVDATPRIGIDEAGKGDFFGPLCIGGIYASEESVRLLISLNVRDSKRMNDSAVLTLASEIRLRFPHHVVKIFPEKYNQLYKSFGNLNQLLAWGHATAIEYLVKVSNCHHAIIDQFAGEHLVENALKRKNLNINLVQRHYGEEDPVVAAASILARAAFLEGLKSLGNEVSQELPKGASSQVIEAGKSLVARRGPEILEKVAKLHFKTREAILNA